MSIRDSRPIWRWVGHQTLPCFYFWQPSQSPVGCAAAVSQAGATSATTAVPPWQPTFELLLPPAGSAYWFCSSSCCFGLPCSFFDGLWFGQGKKSDLKIVAIVVYTHSQCLFLALLGNNLPQLLQGINCCTWASHTASNACWKCSFSPNGFRFSSESSRLGTEKRGKA